MKLLAATAIAALSLVGCASDNDGEGGASLDGLRPAKPSIDDTNGSTVGLNPAIAALLQKGAFNSMDLRGDTDASGAEFISAETLRQPFPIDGICEACDMVVLLDSRNPSELNVIDDFGKFLCHLWVGPDGRIQQTNCR